MENLIIFSPELTDEFMEELLYDNEQSTLDKPYLVIYNTDDDEYSVRGYNNKDEALDDVIKDVSESSVSDDNWMLLGFYENKKELTIKIYLNIVLEE